MCGIALIISGIRIDFSNLIPGFVSPLPQHPQLAFCSVADIKAALSRRGPDSLGSKNICIFSKKSASDGVKHEIVYLIENGDVPRRDWIGFREHCGLANGFSSGLFGELYFVGATLQLRGTNSITQPLVDESKNVLVYNGEIFGGIDISSECNDTEILMQVLGDCCSCISGDHNTHNQSCKEGQDSVPEILSRIRGPWALIYWQNSSNTLWFGRDSFGRRSLLVHWPTPEDSRLLLSSVSPLSSMHESSNLEDENRLDKVNFWEELSRSIHSLSMGSSRVDSYLVGELKRHKWTDPDLEQLIQWERTSVEPMADEAYISHEKDMIKEKRIDLAHSVSMQSELEPLGSTLLVPSQKVLTVLKEAVTRRTVGKMIYQTVYFDCGHEGYAPVAVLFSGGLDSMILAALLDQCLDSKYEIDLLNVSFDGECAPDRISAKAGLNELEKIAPSRRWKLVEINADLLKLTSEMKHVTSLITPAKTYMDLNIGLALWLAAGGDGWVSEGSAGRQHTKYKSEARILLVGSGADEQCAGYGRHKTKFRHGSWLALHEEMQLDMQRIWKRNLGRDDRCIADNGKEARFPFLDEDVIRTLLDIPLWEIADLDLPSGIGDKKILREVANLLGLSGAAVLPKRAIQFGSRIARESNRTIFGSNRAANQASAGSVEIYGS